MSDFDFYIANEGSIAILHSLNDKAKKWVEEYVDVPDWQSPSNVCVEHRFIEDVICGIENSGFKVTYNCGEFLTHLQNRSDDNESTE